jgi:hypothetical protein
MADPTTPKDPATPDSDETVLHKRVFKGKKEGETSDAPASGSDAGAAFGVTPVQLDHTKPLRHGGDSDDADFQPDNGPRR